MRINQKTCGVTTQHVQVLTYTTILSVLIVDDEINFPYT